MNGIVFTRIENVLHWGPCGVADPDPLGRITGDDLLCSKCWDLHGSGAEPTAMGSAVGSEERDGVAPESAPVISHVCPHWEAGPRTVPWSMEECAACTPVEITL